MKPDEGTEMSAQEYGDLISAAARLDLDTLPARDGAAADAARAQALAMTLINAADAVSISLRHHPMAQYQYENLDLLIKQANEAYEFLRRLAARPGAGERNDEDCGACHHRFSAHKDVNTYGGCIYCGCAKFKPNAKEAPRA
jgi:hypothetical protein